MLERFYIRLPNSLTVELIEFNRSRKIIQWPAIHKLAFYLGVLHQYSKRPVAVLGDYVGAVEVYVISEFVYPHGRVKLKGPAELLTLAG